MYTLINFKTKKSFKEAVAAGKRVSIYNPGPTFVSLEGRVVECVEGPHYPKPHTWYAEVEAVNGIVVRIIK